MVKRGWLTDLGFGILGFGLDQGAIKLKRYWDQ